MSSELNSFVGRVIDGKEIQSVGMVPDVQVIHVNLSDGTFARFNNTDELLKVTSDAVAPTDETVVEPTDETVVEPTDETVVEPTDETVVADLFVDNEIV